MPVSIQLLFISRLESHLATFTVRPTASIVYKVVVWLVLDPSFVISGYLLFPSRLLYGITA